MVTDNKHHIELELEEKRVVGGRKDDQDKARIDLIPSETIFALADILTFGAKKYSKHNWLKGMEWGRVYGALMRHLWAWWRGEKADPETGKSHLHHALACLCFLVTYEERGIGQDDRVSSVKQPVSAGRVCPGSLHGRED